MIPLALHARRRILETSLELPPSPPGIAKKDIAEEPHVVDSLCNSVQIVSIEVRREERQLKRRLQGRQSCSKNLQVAYRLRGRNVLQRRALDCLNAVLQYAPLHEVQRIARVYPPALIPREERRNRPNRLEYPGQFHRCAKPLEPGSPIALDNCVPKSPDSPQCSQTVQREPPPGRLCGRLPSNGRILRRPQHFYFHGAILPQDRTANIPPFARGEAA